MPAFTLPDEDLCKIDHPIGCRRHADARQPKIAFDITPVPRTVKPAIHDLACAHRPRSDVFGRYMQGAQPVFDQIYPAMKTVMSKWTFAREHVAAVIQRHRRDKGVGQ